MVKQLGRPLQAQLFPSQSLVVAQQQHSHALLLQAHIKAALVSPHSQRCGFSTGSYSKPPLPPIKSRHSAASRATSADWNDSSLPMKSRQMSFMGHLKLLRWYEVVPALAKARDAGLLLNVHIYSSAISKLGKARQLKLALQLFADMAVAGISPNNFTYSSIIDACAKAEPAQGEKAVELLDQMTATGVDPDVWSYSAAITACGRAGQWQQALQLKQQAISAGIQLDVVIWSALIDACAKAEPAQLQTALGLLREIQAAGISPHVHSYTAAMDACAKAEPAQYQTSLGLLQ